MKTQTRQLSLLETKQVTGGLINLEAPIEYSYLDDSSYRLYGLYPGNFNLNNITPEVSVKFEIMK